MTQSIQNNYQQINVDSFLIHSSFHERMDNLKGVREQALQRHSPRSVVILGAGPAGLTRAIDALLNGHSVKVFEKRANASGRENTVALMKDSLKILENFGAYSYLLENRLIYPASREGNFNVRLKDLEEAMKAVIHELCPEDVIVYESFCKGIVPHDNAKADLIIQTGDREILVPSVDVITVAEGAHGSTNETLLGNHRVSVLPKIPVIAAIFKDHRPSITGMSTLFEYAGKTISNAFTGAYYYNLFAYKCLFQGEHIFNPYRAIAGSVILPTPDQTYLGCGMSVEETRKLSDLRNALKNATEALKQQGVFPEQQTLLEKKVKDAQKQLDDYCHYWTAMGFCFANILSLYRRYHGIKDTYLASWLPLDHVSFAEIGADNSDNNSGMIGQTAYLIAGDSLVTVDPTTGMGCNNAVQTVRDFHLFMEGLEQNLNPNDLLSNYNEACSRVILSSHFNSRCVRELYKTRSRESFVVVHGANGSFVVKANEW